MAVGPASVWVDAQATQGGGSAERGIGRYLVELLKAIHAISPETLGSVRLDPELSAPARLELFESLGLLGWGLDRPGPGEPLPAIYHLPSPFEPVKIDRVWPPWIRAGRDPVRTVVTLHDLIPLVMSDLYLDDHPEFRTFYTTRLGLYRHAHQILAISDATAADAVEHLGVDPGRITMIGAGISDTFSSLVSSAEEAREILESAYPDIRDGFLLYVGGGDPRKNMRGTIDAFARLPAPLRHAHQLVVVCRLGRQATRELRTYSRRLGIDDADLFFAGFVPDRELANMYRRCTLFLFPSLYEGFGLPVLEAMSCGAPVAAANNSSIPEVLGDLDATFDPADPADIAETVTQVLQHPGRLEALRERSRRRVADFTWEKTAAKVLEGYERALARPAGEERRRRGRRRVAIVTPWSPEPSIAAWSSEQLVPSLIQHADVDVLVSGVDGAIDRSLEPQVRFWGADELDWLRELGGYDRYLYVLDGSPRHWTVLEALTRRPGAVLLHDVRLAPLYKALAKEEHWEDRHWLEKKLLELNGHRGNGGEHLTREVQERAEELLVHSRHQLGVLDEERPAGAPEAVLLPAPIPTPPRPLDSAAGRAGPMVVSSGRIDVANRRLDLLHEAFAELASQRPDAYLVLLGEAPERERAALARIAARLGISDAVDVRGRVGIDEYWATLGMADVAVELRADPNAGVVSSPVCDAIAARTPTVVSDVGWLEELPEPVVTKVAAECSPSELAAQLGALSGGEAAAEAREAQEEYAAENTYGKLAGRLAELLGL